MLMIFLKNYQLILLHYVVVETNDKKRFTFNEDKTKIRANQGHSIQVDLELQLQEPPKFLFHGTADKFWTSISQQGLLKMNRQYVIFQLMNLQLKKLVKDMVVLSY